MSLSEQLKGRYVTGYLHVALRLFVSKYSCTPYFERQSRTKGLTSLFLFDYFFYLLGIVCYQLHIYIHAARGFWQQLTDFTQM